MKLLKSPTNKIFRFEVEDLSLNLDDYKSCSDLFFELNNLNEGEEFLNSDFQTMTHFGFEL